MKEARTNITARILALVCFEASAALMHQPRLVSISLLPRQASNGGRGNVPVTFVVGLADARPNAPHQLVMVGLTIVKAAVSFTEGISFLARGNQISFG